MACKLVLTGDPPKETTANLLLDHLLGAQIIWTGRLDPDQILQQAFEEDPNAARKAFLIPYGGSSPLGASAYADALHELLEQDRNFDRIVFATSSGGTQAGMIAGSMLHGFTGTIDGISVDKPSEELAASIAKLTMEVLTLMDCTAEVGPSDVLVDDRFLGGGYAVVGDLECEAIQLFSQMEGLLLDPVYTGRAAGGMLSKIRSGEITNDERVLFWHTGGTPALFAFGDRLLE
jgi:D-cysteine desulfhydrase